MNSEQIKLPRALVNELLHCAQASPELEICGLIGARHDIASSCYVIKNQSPTPENRFQFDAKEHIEAQRCMRERKEDLFAIFHSHPHSPAEPSAIDRIDLAYPDALYLIISLNTKGILEMRGFRLNPQVSEVSLLLD